MSGVDLKAFTLLREFDEQDRECLAELLEEKTVAEGWRVFCEGNEADAVYFLVSGNVRVESRRTGRSESLEPGATLGALSVAAVGPRESTISAETPCELLVLPRSGYRRLVEDYPRTACRLLEAVLEDTATLIRQGLDKLAG